MGGSSDGAGGVVGVDTVVLPRVPPGLAGSDGLFSNIRPHRTLSEQPICCLAIDAEEDFDWNRPVRDTGYSTECMRHVTDLREILAAYGLRPTYLLTYPVLEDPDVVRMLRGQWERGHCELGVQLHPWVTPPFEGSVDHGSYLGNLDPATEERKLVKLTGRFQDVFGVAPVTFRAGRYGLSRSTTHLLERHGFTVDTSLAPRTNFGPFGGPDFSEYDCQPFWFGERRALLEMPLCRGVVGWSRQLAPWLYGLAVQGPLAQVRAASVLSRTRCAERVTLSPEGNDFAAMRRFLSRRQALGQRVFSISFHSSSLWPGRNPYVRSRPELHEFYDRLSAVLTAMADDGFRFATLAEMPGLLGMAE